MSVIQKWRSRAELARSVILSPPRGYATDSWKDSSSTTFHKKHVKGNVYYQAHLCALGLLALESPTVESAKPDSLSMLP